MKYDFSEPKERQSYYFFRSLARELMKFRYDLRYEGVENLPQEGSFIIAANHITFIDPVMIIAGCPRQCHFMAKSELFTKPVFAEFLAFMNAFPVRRESSDMRALSFAQKIINKGWILGIFPEGARSKDMTPKKTRNGAAYLAFKTGADIVPVGLVRDPSYKGLRPTVSVRFGKLIKNEELGFGEDYSPKQIREAAKTIMNEIVGLWKKGHIPKKKEA